MSRWGRPAAKQHSVLSFMGLKRSFLYQKAPISAEGRLSMEGKGLLVHSTDRAPACPCLAPSVLCAVSTGRRRAQGTGTEGLLPTWGERGQPWGRSLTPMPRSGAGPGHLLPKALLEGVPLRPGSGARRGVGDGRRVPHLQSAGRQPARQQHPACQHLRDRRRARQQVTAMGQVGKGDGGGTRVGMEDGMG